MNQTKSAGSALVIVGATASGKSELALALAESNPGVELISVDSMQVYEGMDIGTAKPTLEQQLSVKHHCLDLVSPTQDFSVGMYKTAAQQALSDIYEAGKRPVIVGGTGLYVRALVDNLQIPSRYPKVLAELNKDSDTPALWGRLAELDPKASETMLPTNRRRVLRALEVTLGSGKPFSSFGPGLSSYQAQSSFTQVGICLPRPTIDERISQRYTAQMQAGFLEEAKKLRQMNLSRTARQALGYKELFSHLEGKIDLESALEEAERRTRRFARRQERWFKRDPRVQWLNADEPNQVFSQLQEIFQECV